MLCIQPTVEWTTRLAQHGHLAACTQPQTLSRTPRRPVSQCVGVPGMQRLSGGGQLDTDGHAFRRASMCNLIRLGQGRPAVISPAASRRDV